MRRASTGSKIRFAARVRLSRRIVVLTVALGAALVLLVPSVAWGDGAVAQPSDVGAKGATPPTTTGSSTDTGTAPASTATTTTTTTTTTTPSVSTPKGQVETTPANTSAPAPTPTSTGQLIEPTTTTTPTPPVAAPIQSVVQAGASGTSECAANGSESVVSDKADYSPEETVQLSGAGYASSCVVHIEVTRPDGSIVKGDGSFTPGVDAVTTTSAGTFSDAYRLDGVQGLYRVRVLGAANVVLASMSFTDAPSPSPSDPRAQFFSGNVTTCAGAGFPGTIQVGGEGSASGTNVSGTVATNSGLIQPGVGQEVNVTLLNPAVVVNAVVVKGGPAYNVYSNPAFLPPTLLAPQHYISPLNGGGNVPDIGHWFVCYHLATPPQTGSITVEKVVIEPNGIPVSPLPTSYSAQVSCGGQGAVVSFAGGGGLGVPAPALSNVPTGTLCTVVELNTGSFPAGAVVTYSPVGANTNPPGVTITGTAGVTVTITNDFSNTAVQKGTVSLFKSVAPAGVSGPGTFTANVSCDDGTNVNATFPAVGGPGTPPTVTANAGALCLIAETAIPSGWVVSYSVNGGAASPTPPIVTIVGNQTTSVTITNTAPGSITIVKDAAPDGPATFGFTASPSPPLVPASFTLADSGSPTPFPNRQSYSNVPAGGSYTFTETPTGGFTLGAPVSCTGSSTVTQTTNGVTITLAPGDNVVCTFVNTQQGSITIVKDAVPNGPTAFDFSVAPATVTPSSFKLADNGSSTPFPNRQVLDGVVTGTTYTVTEASTPGFDLDAIDCTGGQTATDVPGGSVAITFTAGDNIVCTFVNTQQGSITIIKDAVPNGPATFGFTASPSPPLVPASFTLADSGSPTPFPNSQTFSNVPAGGSYTFTETPTGGFTLGAPVSCTGSSTVAQTTNGVTITLAPGDNVACTFVNTQQGSITIVKDAIPNGPTAFDFSVAPATVTPASFTLADSGSPTPFPNSQVLAGVVTGTTYTVTEASTPGFDLDAINCTGGQTATDVPGGSVAITFTAGDNIVCTFVNVEQGAIAIVKVSDPQGPATFNFTASPSPTLAPPNFTLDDDGDPNNAFSNVQLFTDLQSGVPYTFTEIPTAGFALTTPVTCVGTQRFVQGEGGDTNAVTVTLSPREGVVCTFVNVQEGSITIVKDAVPNGPTAFDFSVAPATVTPASFTLADSGSPTPFPNSQVLAGVVTGTTDTVTESPTAGFDLTGINCTGGQTATDVPGGSVAITFAAGDNIVCTFVNVETSIENIVVTRPSGTPSTGTSADTSSALAFTGTDTRSLTIAALALITLGTVILRGTTRRRRHSRPHQ
jgi:hypothetical protein